MARPRKKAAKAQVSLLTPDNVVEIPVEEQPYPLPDGWKWTYWGDCGDFIAGNAFKPAFQGKKGLLYPFYKVGSLKYSDNKGYLYDTEHSISEETQKIIKASIIPEHSIIFAKIGEAIRLNRRSINEKKCCIDNNLMAFVPQKITYNYAYYWALSIDLYKYTNATTVPAIRKTDLEKIIFPFPSIDEQQRIVDRIESLFAKLDEAKEKAEAVLDGFETRKAAILHRAFTGELTAKWREENNIQLSSWKQETIASLCHSLKYGTAKKSKKTGSTIVLRMGNLQSGEIDWSNLAYSDDKDDIQKYLLSTHDVLFNRTNSSELVGKTSIYRGEYPAIYAGYLIKMDYDKARLTGLYLNYVMNSHKSKDYCKTVKSDGVNQSNINAKKLGAFIIPVPSLHEQHEITRILDSLLEKEQQAKEAAEIVLEQITVMKKAILARAFRGELTGQVHNEKQR